MCKNGRIWRWVDHKVGHSTLTKLKMAFVHLLCYLISPHPSKTHRSDDLFINAAIMQLATHEIDIMIEQPSFGQKVGQCSSGVL